MSKQLKDYLNSRTIQIYKRKTEELEDLKKDLSTYEELLAKGKVYEERMIICLKNRGKELGLEDLDDIEKLEHVSGQWAFI